MVGCFLDSDPEPRPPLGHPFPDGVYVRNLPGVLGGYNWHTDPIDKGSIVARDRGKGTAETVIDSDDYGVFNRTEFVSWHWSEL